jgi:transposase
VFRKRAIRIAVGPLIAERPPHRSERALRCAAVGRHNWTFAGSDDGGRRAAAIYTLIETCKLSDVDPQPWLADALARLPDHPARRIDELLPWKWNRAAPAQAAA